MATQQERTVYVIELRDKFTRGMGRAANSAERFNRATERSTKGVDKLSRSFSQFGLTSKIALTGAIYGMGRLAMETVKVSAKFETVAKALEVMTGRQGLGAGLMDWATEFSRSTIITFDQTVTSIRKLLAYGISEQNVRPLTEMLSTISAGVGTDRLPYLTLALGQVKSRGRLMGTELRQFREHGVDIISELGKVMGVATPRVEEMVTQGLVSFDMVVQAMQSMVQPGGRFYMMLEEMAKTATGQFNVLRSTWSLFLKDMGDMMMPTLKRIMSSVTEFVNYLRNMAPAVAAMGQAFGTMFRDMFGEATQGSLINKLTQAKAIAGIMMTLGGVVTTVFDSIGYIFDLVTEKVKQVHAINMAFSDLMANFVANQGQSFGTDLNRVMDALGDFVTGDGGATDRFIQRETEMWNKIIDAINKPLTPQELLTGEYVPGSEIVGGEGTDGGNKTRTNRKIGTGARDIVINIGNLVENVTNNNQRYDDNVDAMVEHLRRSLLTVVNDVSQNWE